MIIIKGRTIKGPYIVNSGLVLYLDAGNTRSYPGSGTIWSDLKFNYNGTLTNGPTYNSSNGGNIVFDGVNDYVSTSSNLAASTNPFSIDIWFKTDGLQVNNATLICIAAAAANSNWQLSFNGALSFQAGGGVAGASTYTETNTWTNVTVSRETTSTNGSKIYINGTLNVSFTLTNDFTDTPGYRLGMNRGSNAFFKGSIASAKIYSKGLSATEVLQNYNAQKAKFGLI
jgi:hypothetical protein